MLRPGVLFSVFAFLFLGSSLAMSQDKVAEEVEPQLWCEYPAGEGIGSEKHIVLLSGDEEYRSEESMPMLGRLLSKRHGFKCTVIFAINPNDGTIDPDNQQNMPGIEALATADLVIMSLRFRDLPDEQMKHFDDYVKSGKPIIALRTSTHAFKMDAKSSYGHYSFNSKEGWTGGFGQQVLGDTWVNHHGNHGKESTAGMINPECVEHPILTGVVDIWGPTDVYGLRNLPESASVLVHGQVLAGMEPDSKPVDGKKNDPMVPVVWTKEFENENGNTNQVVCTTMGASIDLANEGLRRLVVNASLWLLDMSDEISPDLNVEPVGAYEPSMFGFKSWTKGRRPADFNLAK